MPEVKGPLSREKRLERAIWTLKYLSEKKRPAAKLQSRAESFISFLRAIEACTEREAQLGEALYTLSNLFQEIECQNKHCANLLDTIDTSLMHLFTTDELQSRLEATVPGAKPEEYRYYQWRIDKAPQIESKNEDLSAILEERLREMDRTEERIKEVIKQTLGED